MTRMLDILEQFLNYHGHTYLRLDGNTKVEQRQVCIFKCYLLYNRYEFITTEVGDIKIKIVIYV